MKRWLSLIKRHATPTLPWTKPAKKRRPLTVMTQTTVAQEIVSRAPSPMPSDFYVTAPLVPIRAPKPVRPPLCDVDAIMARYTGWQSPSPILYVPPVLRPDSQTLPIGDIPIPASAFVEHSFIHFEPTYRVTVSEVAPHRLVLRKPRFERVRKAVSFLPGVSDGQVRFSTAVHFEE